MKQFILLAALFVLSGCGWMYEFGQDSEFDITEADIYVPDFTFTNQEQQSFGMDQLDGDYWLANFAFTNCTTVCLTMMPNMNYVKTELTGAGHQVQFVTFSADPINDTPEQLNAYATNIGAEAVEWAFLTGYELDEIEQFSNEGFRVPYAYGETPEDIIHSTSFFLVNREGLVVRKYNGLQMDQDEIVEDIVAYVTQDS